jgi:single-stranded-DNA-specific exonuclease
MNYKWNYQPPTLQEREAARALSREIGISPILCKLLQERGIHSAAEAKRFFRPQLNDLHDPFLMNDMDVAVERLNLAMGRKERILVYGDYDVDGTTAVALVFKFLQQFYSNIDYYIPDRYNEGYGVSKKGVDYAYSTGVKLVIVLDCGIKAVEEISYAKEKGIDFIICDHHMPDDTLPDAVAVLDAKRVDSIYPYEHLSGCGVGFKLMQKDVFLNIAGGLRVTDMAMDLSVIAAVLSSNVDTPIESGWCMAGEVGLSGEVRPVNRIEQRIAEAEKLGFTDIILPAYNVTSINPKKYNIRIHPVKKVEEALRVLFG